MKVYNSYKMGFFNSVRLDERREGLNNIKYLDSKISKVLIIHYSCESFTNKHKRTPRISAICIKNRVNNETKSFSIHLTAEKLGIKLNYITNDEYEMCEKSFLQDFINYISGKRGYILVHWKMRNATYGFEALINRFKILKSTNEKLNWLIEFKKYDLSFLLEQIYSKNYALNPNINKRKGGIIDLAEINNLPINFCLSGKEEGDFFEKKEYVKIHNSTVQKVEIIDEILRLSLKDELNTYSHIYQKYGLTLSGVIDIIKNNKILTFALSLIIFFVSAACEPIIQRVLGTAEQTSWEPSKKRVVLIDSLTLQQDDIQKTKKF